MGSGRRWSGRPPCRAGARAGRSGSRPCRRAPRPHHAALTEPGRSLALEPAALIGLDWGTSALRAYRVAGDGRVLVRREAPRGILAVQDGAFAEALAEAAGDWFEAEPD